MQEEIEAEYKKGALIHLKGFTSSTLDRKIAISFAFKSLNLEVDDPDKSPILMEIEFSGIQQFIHLNSRDVSAFD